MNAAPTIANRVTIIGVATMLAVALAMLAPGETAATGTFSNGGGLDLKIDSKAWYNGATVPSATWSLKNLVPGTDKFFNFSDVKPGDFGCNVISIHAQKSDAYACLDFKNLTNNDNGVNEPEAPVDPNGNASGELASGTQFFGWIDDGNGTYEPPKEKKLFGTQPATTALNDKSYVIGDSKSGGSCRQNTTKYVGICWCAGTLTVNPATGKMTCDGSTLGNAAQTDSFSVDVFIRATDAKSNTSFACGSKPPKGEGGKDDTEHEGKGDKGKGDEGDKGDDWHRSSNEGFHWPWGGSKKS